MAPMNVMVLTFVQVVKNYKKQKKTLSSLLPEVTGIFAAISLKWFLCIILFFFLLSTWFFRLAGFAVCLSLICSLRLIIFLLCLSC